MLNRELKNTFYRVKWRLIVALLIAISAAIIEVLAIYLLGLLLANTTQEKPIDIELPIYETNIEIIVILIIFLRIMLGIGSVYAKTDLVNRVRRNILLDFNSTALEAKRELSALASKSEFTAAFFTELNVFCYGFLNHLMQILNDLVMLCLFAVLVGMILGFDSLIWMLIAMVVIGFSLLRVLKAGRRYGLRRQTADQSLANYIASSYDASANIIIENRVQLYKTYLETALISVSKANLAAQLLIGMPKIIVDAALLIIVAAFTLLLSYKAELSLGLGDASVLLLLIIRGLPIAGRLVTTLQNINYTKVSISAISKQFDRIENKLNNIYSSCFLKFTQCPGRHLECEFKSESGAFVTHQFAASDGLIAIKGASGVGKTSFLKAIGGVTNNTYSRFVPKGGEIPKFAIISQNGLEFNYETSDFLNLTLSKTSELSSMLNVETEKLRNLKSVEEIKSKYSGGEFERIQLVRCLASDIDILLMDETGSGLDKKNKFAMLKALEKRSDLIRILVTHDDVLLTHANRVIEFN